MLCPFPRRDRDRPFGREERNFVPPSYISVNNSKILRLRRAVFVTKDTQERHLLTPKVSLSVIINPLRYATKDLHLQRSLGGTGTIAIETFGGWVGGELERVLGWLAVQGHKMAEAGPWAAFRFALPDADSWGGRDHVYDGP